MPFFIFAFILVVIVSFIQGFVSVLYAGLFALSVCLLCAFFTPKGERKNAIKFAGLTFCIYWISAAIVSTSFEYGQFFYVIDPSAYYSIYKYIHSFRTDEYLMNLSDLYLAFSDNNALYNMIMAWLAYLGNTVFDGANMMYYTTFHMLFGVLSSIAIYRLLCSIEKPRVAYKHALIFCLISLFHIYSCVCLRDIWIAATFLWAIVIIQRSFSIKGLLALILLFLFAVGMRIYSGLFFTVFIAYYLFKIARDSRIKPLVYLIICVLALVVISSAVGSLLIEQTMSEVNDVYEEQMGRGVTGLSAYIYNFPHGIREVVMIFYSQIMPFPSYMYYSDASTFSHYYISTLVLIFPLISFVSFYGLFYVFITKKAYKLLNIDDWALVAIALMLAVSNSSQMDIRRIMPSFVIFYYCYNKIFVLKPQLTKKNVNLLMCFGYIGLLLVYAYIKYR